MLCLHWGMIRTQIQLTEEQARRLRKESARRGVSVAELVRTLVDRGLEEDATGREDRYRRAASLVGQFRDRDGARDVSRRHDDYLAEAFE